MTVKDLIAQLSELEQDKEIVFYSSEEGNGYKVEEVGLFHDVDWDGDGKEKYIIWVG